MNTSRLSHYYSSSRLQQLERTIRRIRSTIFDRDDEDQDKATRTIASIKRHCARNWKDRHDRVVERRLEGMGH